MRITIDHGQVTITLEDPALMATLAEVQAGIADLQATAQAVEDGVDRVLVVVQALRDEADSGGNVTAEDLDGVMAGLVAAKAPLTDSLAKEGTV